MSVQQWSAEETNALLAIWSTREIQDKLEGSVRKKRVYEEIAGVVNKLKKLKEYRDQKREMGKSGSGRRKMVHFDVIDSILGHRPASQSTGALNSATYLLESMGLIYETNVRPKFGRMVVFYAKLGIYQYGRE